MELTSPPGASIRNEGAEMDSALMGQQMFKCNLTVHIFTWHNAPVFLRVHGNGIIHRRDYTLLQHLEKNHGCYRLRNRSIYIRLPDPVGTIGAYKH